MSSIRSLRNRSSPATFAESTPPLQETIELQHTGNGLAKQARLDRWVEPNVRSGIASFEDTKGLERVGVLEHMQPLGTTPNMRLLHKLKVTGFRPSPSARATPIYSEGVASPSVAPSRDEVSSPMLDPELLLDTPPPPQIQPSLQEAAVPPELDVQQQDEEVVTEQSMTAMSPPRGRPSKRDANDMDYSPASGPAALPSRVSPRNTTAQEQQKGDRFRGFLQNAISRAARDGKHEVASGLDSVLAAADRDEVITALENISKYKGSVRMEQFKVFKHYIKKGIRKHRRLASQNELDADQHSSTTSQTKPMASVSNFYSDGKKSSPSDTTFTSQNAVKSPLTLRMGNLEPGDKTSPRKLRPHSPTLADALAYHVPSHKPEEQSHRSAPRRRRSSSASSLSSALSIPSNYGDATKQTPNMGVRDQAAESWPSKPVASRQAPARAATGRTTRLSGMDFPAEQLTFETQFSKNLNPSNTDVVTKRQKLSSQFPALTESDTEEVRQRRKEFEDATERGYNYRAVQTIKERPDRELSRSRSTQRQRLQQPIGPPPPKIHPYSLTHSKKADVSSPATSEFPFINGASRKRNYDEYAKDDNSSRLSSPLSSSPISEQTPERFWGDQQPTSNRASTPRVAKAVLPSKARKTPRTMISPRKAKNGTSNATGATRAGITKDTVMTNGMDANGEKQENEDECRACGDAGLLLLCEGCPNSFHGDCLEPPVSIDDVEGDWYCPECEARRRPQTAQSEDVYRIMRPLVDQINDTYPRVYSLPAEIRSYFENVKTGEEGEYIEVIAPPTNKKGAPRTDNSGAMKPPNYKDLRDKHGNLRLCYKCGLTTGGEREMMPCDYCTNEWHLDCLDPPASVIPKRFGPDGKPPPPWRCPLHIERDLIEHSRAHGVEVGHLGRQPRLRRPKNAASVLQTFSRPVPSNNGIIDVQLEPELPDLNVKTVEMGGIVIRIPEKKVILDFIRKARWEYYYDIHLPIEKGVESKQFHSHYWLPDNPKFHEDAERTETVAHVTTDDNRTEHRDVSPGRTSFNETAEMIPQRLRPFSSDGSSLSSYAATEVLARRRLDQKPFVEQQTVRNLVELSGASGRPQSSGSSFGLSNLIDQLIADAPEDVTQNIQLSELEQLDLLQKLLEERRNTVRAAINGYAVNSHASADKTQQMKAKLNGSLMHDVVE